MSINWQTVSIVNDKKKACSIILGNEPVARYYKRCKTREDVKFGCDANASKLKTSRKHFRYKVAYLGSRCVHLVTVVFILMTNDFVNYFLLLVQYTLDYQTSPETS